MTNESTTSRSVNDLLAMLKQLIAKLEARGYGVNPKQDADKADSDS